MRGFLLFLLGLTAGAATVVTVHRATPQSGRTESTPPALVERIDATLTNTQEEVRLSTAEEASLSPDQEIRVLRRRVIARDREIARLKGSTGTTDGGSTNTARQGWLEELKTTDPERYREIVERREQGRQAAKYQIAKRAAHFLSKDRSMLNEEERDQRELMLSLLEESLTITEKIRSDMPEPERREMSRMLRDNLRELYPLLDVERERELMQLGLDMGYPEADAADFVLLVNDILDMTSVSSIFRDSMRQMGGWDGWGRRGEERGPDRGPERDQPAR